MVTTIDTTGEAAEQRIAFVKLPQAVDVTNHCLVLDSLTRALRGQSSFVIADGTGTEFCDCAGISALVSARHRAAAAGAHLRVVAASMLIQRIINLTAADELLDVYLTMDSALADMTGPGAALSSGRLDGDGVLALALRRRKPAACPISPGPTGVRPSSAVARRRIGPPANGAETVLW